MPCQFKKRKKSSRFLKF